MEEVACFDHARALKAHREHPGRHRKSNVAIYGLPDWFPRAENIVLTDGSPCP